MQEQILPLVSSLRGEVQIPPDKSISHRAFMLAAIANGTSYIQHPLLADDVLRTIHAFRQMGIDIIEETHDRYIVHGKGLYGLEEPTAVIDVGNSGTTMRLLMGILAAQPFHTVLLGDDSLSRRPMSRVTMPLRAMGAQINGRDGAKYAPLAIQGTSLQGMCYEMPVASAQVKSALLLAGLYADGDTVIEELQQTRNHTELMFTAFGVEVKQLGKQVAISKQQALQATEIRVPGDFSSAAFIIVAALLVPNSEVILRNVGVNPTRTGLLTVLSRMGVKLEELAVSKWGGEPVADLKVTHQSLKGTIIDGELIPLLIDELPIIAVLATQAEGVTEIRNAEELRVKESDRISAIVTELRKMNAAIEELPDGIRIIGKSSLIGATVNAYHDHRIAMSLLVASLIAEGKTIVNGIESIQVSYPRFIDDLKQLIIN